MLNFSLLRVELSTGLSLLADGLLVESDTIIQNHPFPSCHMW